MPLVHLVRHGHAVAGWGDHVDPGLDQLGRAQAQAVARELGHELDPARLVSSPLRRAVETAQPLADAWERPVLIDPAFGEIPSPTDDLALRQEWLAVALAGSWDGMDESVTRWRHELIDATRRVGEDAVVFTHFVAINALVAAATLDPAVTVFLPANASVTTLEVSGPGTSLRLVRLGSQAPPEIG